MRRAFPVPCADWAEQLAAQDTDDLTAAERFALKQHVQSCAACAAVQLFYTQMDADIRSLPSAKPLHSLSLPALPEANAVLSLQRMNTQAPGLHGARYTTGTALARNHEDEAAYRFRSSRRAAFTRTVEMTLAVATVACLILAALLILRHPSSATGGTTLTPQEVYRQSTRGKPALVDSLQAEDANDWDVGVNCSFSGGAYHVTSEKAHYVEYCLANTPSFSNVAFQAQMTILKGNDGGLVFRAVSETQLYRFVVNQNGTYYLSVSGSAANCKGLANGTSSAINKGLGQTNLLTVIARGQTMWLYINGKYVTQTHDGTPAAGAIGFLALNETTPTDVVYRNVKVWRL